MSNRGGKPDYDKERRRERVRKNGAEPTDITLFRAVPASDKQVAKLVALGYRGERPATSAAAEELIRKYRPKRLPVSVGQVDKLGNLEGIDRTDRALELLRLLDDAFRDADERERT